MNHQDEPRTNGFEWRLNYSMNHAQMNGDEPDETKVRCIHKEGYPPLGFSLTKKSQMNPKNQAHIQRSKGQPVTILVS